MCRTFCGWRKYMRPVIGITPSITPEEDRIQLARGYYEAIQQAGGMPYIMPCGREDLLDEFIMHIDGLLLTGGGDLDPQLYGQMPHPQVGAITPKRDAWEIELTRKALSKAIPILGICRGIQVLAVACGGDLYQDLLSTHPNESVIKHMQQAPRWYPSHSVELTADSLLSHIFGTNCIKVNSFHHQAILSPGKDLVISAVAPDGVTEGVEHSTYPFVVGVQWHPECMIQNSQQILLFEALVKASVKN